MVLDLNQGPLIPTSTLKSSKQVEVEFQPKADHLPRSLLTDKKMEVLENFKIRLNRGLHLQGHDLTLNSCRSKGRYKTECRITITSPWRANIFDLRQPPQSSRRRWLETWHRGSSWTL